MESPTNEKMVKKTQQQQMNLKTAWTTRKVRRETDQQNVQTKHQKRNQNDFWRCESTTTPKPIA